MLAGLKSLAQTCAVMPGLHTVERNWLKVSGACNVKLVPAKGAGAEFNWPAYAAAFANVVFEYTDSGVSELNRSLEKYPNALPCTAFSPRRVTMLITPP